MLLIYRVNLRFEGEDEDKFLKRIEMAEEYRKMSETFLKYDHMIDTMNTPTHKLTEDVKNRILYFVLVIAGLSSYEYNHVHSRGSL